MGKCECPELHCHVMMAPHSCEEIMSLYWRHVTPDKCGINELIVQSQFLSTCSHLIVDEVQEFPST